MSGGSAQRAQRSLQMSHETTMGWIIDLHDAVKKENVQQVKDLLQTEEIKGHLLASEISLFFC